MSTRQEYTQSAAVQQLGESAHRLNSLVGRDPDADHKRWHKYNVERIGRGTLIPICPINANGTVLIRFREQYSRFMRLKTPPFQYGFCWENVHVPRITPYFSSISAELVSKNVHETLRVSDSGRITATDYFACQFDISIGADDTKDVAAFDIACGAIENMIAYAEAFNDVNDTELDSLDAIWH